MAKYLKIDFSPFIPLIQQSFHKNKWKSTEFNEKIEQLTRINLVDLFKENLSRDGDKLAEESLAMSQNAGQNSMTFTKINGLLEGSNLDGVSMNHGRRVENRSLA